MKLSVTIIVKNEANEIRPCLESVKWADEIIILDSGSTDGTLAICKEFTDKVYETDWPGYGVQKQRALDKATNKWVLSIDADERVSTELKEEMLRAVTDETVSGYYLPRLSYVCGQAIRHSGWYPDYIIRLVQKDKAVFTEDLVHEKLEVQGATKKLKHHINHYSYRNYAQVIEKYNNYSDMGAEELYKQGRLGGFWKALSSGIGAFFKLYVLKLGFLDGKMGFVVAITSAETAFYKYLKLDLLYKNKS